MGDIEQKNASLPVFVMGSDSTGTETYPVRATPNQDLGVTDLLVSGGVQAAMSVGTSAVAARVGVSNLSNRKSLTVLPTDGNIYWGYTNAVTTSSGTVIYRDQQVTFAASDAVTIWLIAAASRNVRITEGG